MELVSPSTPIAVHFQDGRYIAMYGPHRAEGKTGPEAMQALYASIGQKMVESGVVPVSRPARGFLTVHDVVKTFGHWARAHGVFSVSLHEDTIVAFCQTLERAPMEVGHAPSGPVFEQEGRTIILKPRRWSGEFGEAMRESPNTENAIDTTGFFRFSNGGKALPPDWGWVVRADDVT